MKRNLFFILLALEAAFCLAFYYLQAQVSGLFSSVIAFPFEQIGWGLRRLSLSGSAGNILAIVLYLLISLAPCMIYVLLRRGQKHCRADLLLFVLSALLFTVNYYMVNPGLFLSEMPGGGKILLGGTFYSLFWGYVVIRILQNYRRVDAERFQRGLRTLLHIVILLLVYSIFQELLGNLPAALQKVREANSSAGFGEGLLYTDPDLGMTFLFLTLRSAVNALPYLLDILVAFAAVRLLDELIADRYSDQAVEASGRLGRLCVRSLTITVVSGMVFHLLQLLFHDSLRDINTVVSIPVLSIVFVLAVLLLAGYIRENQALKQDNDLFI